MQHMVPSLKIKKLYKDVLDPTKAHPTDSGYDLYAYRFLKVYAKGTGDIGYVPPEDEYSIELPSLGRVLIATGISATVGEGYEIQIRPRSGNALKKGLTVLNTPGTVDDSYRGDISVIVFNSTHKSVEIKLGERIAQAVVCPVTLSEIEFVEELPSTVRGAGGFGSTGA